MSEMPFAALIAEWTVVCSPLGSPEAERSKQTYLIQNPSPYCFTVFSCLWTVEVKWGATAGCSDTVRGLGRLRHTVCTPFFVETVMFTLCFVFPLVCVAVFSLSDSECSTLSLASSVISLGYRGDSSCQKSVMSLSRRACRCGFWMQQRVAYHFVVAAHSGGKKSDSMFTNTGRCAPKMIDR